MKYKKIVSNAKVGALRFAASHTSGWRLVFLDTVLVCCNAILAISG
jgi:hypothetical protein